MLFLIYSTEFPQVIWQFSTGSLRTNQRLPISWGLLIFHIW
ncbi:MAG: hypothetical protein ACKO11_17070 [Cuspidothrix sp.]